MKKVVLYNLGHWQAGPKYDIKRSGELSRRFWERMERIGLGFMRLVLTPAPVSPTYQTEAQALAYGGARPLGHVMVNQLDLGIPAGLFDNLARLHNQLGDAGLHTYYYLQDEAVLEILEFAAKAAARIQAAVEDTPRTLVVLENPVVMCAVAIALTSREWERGHVWDETYKPGSALVIDFEARLITPFY